jgi:predicted  nucleic acid-binding Zn-ribbon protein
MQCKTVSVLPQWDPLLAFIHETTEAIVGLEHEVCMGCHTKVTARTRVNIKADKTVVHCENCGRILYAVE